MGTALERDDCDLMRPLLCRILLEADGYGFLVCSDGPKVSTVSETQHIGEIDLGLSSSHTLETTWDRPRSEPSGSKELPSFH